MKLKSSAHQALLHHALETHRAGNFEEAKILYKEFLSEDPSRTDVLYNLALSSIALGEVEEAINTLEKVLEKIPAHADALNNLGALLLKKNQHEQALQCFAAVLTGMPAHPEARNNIAAVLFQLGRYFHAAEHYRYLLESTPDDISVLYSYGLTLIELGEFEEAIIQFQKITARCPDHLDAISNMGIAYLKAGNLEKAGNYFEAVLEKLPEHPEIRYLYQALTQKEMPDKPPPQYIQNLFDQYANRYEQHMTDILHYNTPSLLYKLLEKNSPLLPDRTWKILDLGCGTGLSGLAFRHLSQSMTGIDLSEKMLASAKRKLIYDILIKKDILDFLQENKTHYDLICAVDTFNYMGDLQKLFELCKSALKSQAYFIFSLEALENNDQDWHLETHGRYLHSKKYVEKIAVLHHFKVISIERTVLREQNHSPAQGYLCLLQLP
jgi:predicted TPR repeat methyltransferase